VKAHLEAVGNLKMSITPELPGPDLIEVFDSLWQLGVCPEVADYLAGAGQVGADALVTLLCIDQGHRWRREDRRPAEAYLQAFPALEKNPEDVVELIYAEFRVREELGEAPRAQEYLERFPAYAPRLRLQLELHQALAGDSGSDAGTADFSQEPPA
jgi:hypothetical protein